MVACKSLSVLLFLDLRAANHVITLLMGAIPNEIQLNKSINKLFYFLKKDGGAVTKSRNLTNTATAENCNPPNTAD